MLRRKTIQYHFKIGGMNMAYDPYQDVASLLAGVKRDAQSAAASAVNDILKSNNTV